MRWMRRPAPCSGRRCRRRDVCRTHHLRGERPAVRLYSRGQRRIHVRASRLIMPKIYPAAFLLALGVTILAQQAPARRQTEAVNRPPRRRRIVESKRTTSRRKTWSRCIRVRVFRVAGFLRRWQIHPVQRQRQAVPDSRDWRRGAGDRPHGHRVQSRSRSKPRWEVANRDERSQRHGIQCRVGAPNPVAGPFFIHSMSRMENGSPETAAGACAVSRAVVDNWSHSRRLAETITPTSALTADGFISIRAEAARVRSGAFLPAEPAPRIRLQNASPTTMASTAFHTHHQTANGLC